MLCESHYKDVSNVEGAYQVAMEILKNENSVLKTENEELKSEIEHLQSKIHQLQTTAGTHKNFTSDDNNQVDIRTTTDKLRDDLECFKKEINKQMNAQFDELRNLLSNNKCRLSNIDSTHKSYSGMLKKPRDAVIFKPKTAQDFQATQSVLKKKIKPTEVEVGIQNIKQMKDGAIAISCNTKEELAKLEEAARKDIGENYHITKPRLHNPKVKIVGLTDELDEDDLKKCLKNQNPSLKNINGMFKLIACKKMKTRFLTIVEVDPQTFSELIKLERVYIGWDVCRVYEHVNVIRCFNCGGFNHISKNCPIEEPTCLNCGEKDEKEKGTCKKEVICVNCTRRNREESLNLSVNHSCFSYSCETYKKQVLAVKNRIRYTT
jgi:cell division protein FtsB